MNPRDRIHQLFETGTADRSLDDLLDEYRTWVLRKATDRLRAIPVQCTALTGPVWYGQGWKDALTVLEEIAEYREPDDSYPGELNLLRGLLLNLRPAVRNDDMGRVRWLISNHEIRATEASETKSCTSNVPKGTSRE